MNENQKTVNPRPLDEFVKCSCNIHGMPKYCPKCSQEKLKALEEVAVSLIYHGRHFSKHRDEIVIRKSIGRLNDIFNT